MTRADGFPPPPDPSRCFAGVLMILTSGCDSSSSSLICASDSRDRQHVAPPPSASPHERAARIELARPPPLEPVAPSRAHPGRRLRPRASRSRAASPPPSAAPSFAPSSATLRDLVRRVKRGVLMGKKGSGTATVSKRGAEEEQQEEQRDRAQDGRRRGPLRARGGRGTNLR